MSDGGYDRFDRRAEDTAGRFAAHPWWMTLKTAAGVAVIVLVITALVGLLSTGSPFFDAFQAKLTAHARVTTKVYNPDNIIGQVNFFTTTCENVTRDYNNWHTNESSYQQELALARTASNAGDQVDAQGQAQQLANYVSGALTNLQNDAAAYNARSINYTANPFKSHGLPRRITVPSIPAALNHWTPPSCG